MRYYADLHVHSKYSRACSRDGDLMNLAWWARRKGITLVGTGDFTHPGWSEELRSSLVPAEPGLFKLRDELDREVLRTLPPSCHRPVRFMLEVEISTIYKRGDKTRKVHHLCYVPDFDAAEAFTKSLAKIGNLASDGRPILGLDSRDLLEITLDSGPASYLVPAHAWTPWFAVLGSKSGFDAVEECYADLAGYIFAVETGLSSDPEMNWRVSSLDRYRLVSSSDAHSPPILGRNATIVDTDLDYFALRGALKTGEGYVGTVDMFPEEGKYHWDGHRKCGVGMEPAETRTLGGLCPECGKPVTVGVLHRVDALADRAPGRYPATAGESRKIVPLPEIMGEIMKVGPKSKRVRQAIDELVGTLGPELDILLELPLEEIAKARSPQLTEAVSRLRAGRVLREAGYDGEYGKISLFAQGEEFGEAEDGLFDMPAPPMPEPVATVARKPRAPGVADVVDTSDSPMETMPSGGTGSLLDALDPDQRAAASIVEGQLMVVAGPGTGKTRTLTHRLAHLVTEHGVPPERCVAITFTRRAAEELAERLDALVPEHAARITVATFHRFGLGILREQHALCELPADFELAGEVTRVSVLREILEVDHRAARRALAEVSRIKRIMAARLAASASGELPFDEELDGDVLAVAERYDKALHNRNLVDFDDLIARPVALLARHPELVEQYRARYGWLCVDEYQDVDELQYRLLRLLAPARGNLCVIGDPDQAIYAFRGADVGYFLRFQHDFPDTQTVQLTRNYRSSKVIVSGAVSAIAPSTLVADRELQPMRERSSDRARIVLHAASDEDGEARFIARTIEELLGGSSFHARDSGLVDSDGIRGGLSFDDIAVLYRTDAQARAVMDVLGKVGLPFQKRSHDRLGDHPGVRAVLRHVSHDEGQSQGGTPMLLWRAAQRAISELEADATADPDGSVDAVRDAVDLLGPLARRHAGDAAAFLADLSLGAEVDTWDPRANRISLLTLHAAKGLEFPVVFIAGCADGLLPLRWPGSSDYPAERSKEEAEERRLFFVGITRAQSHLYLSYPRTRTRGEDTVDLRPSPFLSVLGDDILERREDQPKRNAARGKQLRLL